jgi:hypothetical protein
MYIRQRATDLLGGPTTTTINVTVIAKMEIVSIVPATQIVEILLATTVLQLR